MPRRTITVNQGKLITSAPPLLTVTLACKATGLDINVDQVISEVRKCLTEWTSTENAGPTSG